MTPEKIVNNRIAKVKGYLQNEDEEYQKMIFEEKLEQEKERYEQLQSVCLNKLIEAQGE